MVDDVSSMAVELSVVVVLGTDVEADASSVAVVLSVVEKPRSPAVDDVSSTAVELPVVVVPRSPAVASSEPAPPAKGQVLMSTTPHPKSAVAHPDQHKKWQHV